MLSTLMKLVSRNKGKDEESVEDGDAGSVEDTVGASVHQEPETEKWYSSREFLLSSIAMSVGLGNVWRFPFVALENGGGAFLILYILVIIFIGRPLYYMELCMGQFSSSGSIKVWDLSPAFRGLGYSQALATWAVVTYYVSLMALTIYYFFASFSSVLPWSLCGSWSSETCVDLNTNAHDLAATLGISVTNLTSAAEEYFSKEVLKIDPMGVENGLDAPEWHLTLCLLFSWMVLFAVLINGIHCSSKTAYFTAIFPYAVLLIMLVRGVMLQGSLNGVIFFVTPRWEKLVDPSVWYAAIDQSFFSLSVGFGTIVMFSSYNKFRHDLYRDASVICLTDTLTSLLAGFITFAILGHLAEELGVEVKDVVKGGGTSLAFVSFPDVLSTFPYVPQLFSMLFFLMLFILGLSTASALTSTITSVTCHVFPCFKKSIVTLIVCILGFLLGLIYVTPQGHYLLELINYYGGGFIVFVLVVFEIVAVHWVYGVNNFCRDIEFMLGRKTDLFCKTSWVFLIPVLLSITFMHTLITAKPLAVGSYVFSSTMIDFGICLAALPFTMVPILFLVEVARRLVGDASLWEALVKSLKASDEWCPKDPVLRQEYRNFISGTQSP
nr:sodium-dependent nutrient amino acid transporter 1-like [Cherax quadricarinatus]